MDHIFLAVQDRLRAKVPELKWIDYDFGQLDVYQLRPPVQFPCALIDIEIPETRDMGNLVQNCKCTITIRVALEQPGQTNDKAPRPVKDRAMGIFLILKKIHAGLHGFEGEGFNKILRRSLTTERREDPLKVFNFRFETSYTEEIPKQWIEQIVEPVIMIVEPEVEE